jgi:hypothetical protein
MSALEQVCSALPYSPPNYKKIAPALTKQQKKNDIKIIVIPAAVCQKGDRTCLICSRTEGRTERHVQAARKAEIRAKKMILRHFQPTIHNNDGCCSTCLHIIAENKYTIPSSRSQTIFYRAFLLGPFGYLYGTISKNW